MTDKPNNDHATITLTIDDVPELVFIWIPQGPMTKLGIVMVRRTGTQETIANIGVDASSDDRETMHVVESVCRLFAHGYTTYKKQQ